MFKGLRVVRGPDWMRDDQDGGVGCVGTVVPSQSPGSIGGAWVRWDKGTAANYRTGGNKGKFDLRVFDNASLGVKHQRYSCNCCCEDVIGMRWKCRQCDDCNLCHKCYHNDKHNLEHTFTRIDAHGVTGVDVPCRKWSAKCQSMGMFKGARVKRGIDWTWGNQDGGDGTVGIVLRKHSIPGSYRSLVNVKWPNGTRNLYRCGNNGKMELQCTERETGGEFYIDHLPVLDESDVRPYVDSGDKVRLLDISLDKLKELQLKRCGWNDEMAKFKGEVGEAIMVDKDGDVKVKFGGSSFFINPMCLTLEEKKTNGVGEVKDTDGFLAQLVKTHLDTMKKAFGDHGSSEGQALFHLAATGNNDKVQEMIKNKPDMMKFQNEKGQTPLQAAAHRGHLEVVKTLVAGKAPLEQKDEDGNTALTYAVLGKEPEVIEFLLRSGSDINQANKQGLTPLHLAVATGHRKCAEELLKHEQINLNYQDSRGNSPLFIAVIKADQKIIQMVLESPRVDLKLQNKDGFNCLHHAAGVGNSFAVEKILRAAPSMINIPKNDGFTALHVAAVNNNPEIVLTLIKQGNCDTELQTVTRQTALHLAIDLCHNKCVEALVNNGANVNAQDKDGHTSLHLVMMKAAVKDIFGSTPMGKLMELIQKVGNEGESSDEQSNLIATAVYLLKNDADISIKNNKGQTVLDVTHNQGLRSLLKDVYEQKRIAERLASATKNETCKVS